jgi:hypothetical protein
MQVDQVSSRRNFVKRTIATVAAAAAVPFVQANERKSRVTPSARRSVIKAAVRRDETIVRHGVIGDIFPMTWMSDDRQFLSFSDGNGLADAVNPYNTGGLWISGGPTNAELQKVTGYPQLPSLDDDIALQQRYYGFGVLAVDGSVYQALSMLDRPVVFNRPNQPGSHWVGAKLIFSQDAGRTWHNQNGSTPVVWERWEDRSKQSMLFFEEAQDAFSLLTFLQMGKNYEHNRDGYVYGYAPNGYVDGTMNELVLFRVAKGRFLDRRAFEYFSGRTFTGDARWSSNINARKPLHVFPRGWVNKPLPGSLVVQSWVPSVVYNQPLDLYMMVAAGAGPGPQGEWLGKPSYFGIWVATKPWGPWDQIAQETAWTPNKESAATCYSPQIAPKWISADGKSLWMTWSDSHSTCSAEEGQHLQEQQKRITDPQQLMKFNADVSRRCSANCVFNTQRVDLIVTEA